MRLFDFFNRKEAVNQTHDESPSISIEISYSKQKSSSYDEREGISLHNLLQEATPSRQGLYPHEIYVLSKAPKYRISDREINDYWIGGCCVEDIPNILNSLCNKGFIQPGSLRDAIWQLKVSEIKEDLSAAGEKVSGKKSDLIDRLLSSDHVDLDVLAAKYPERYYKLTDKGESELAENEYITYLDKHEYMTIWEMNRKLNNNPEGFSYRDLIWQKLNKDALNFRQQREFGLYRNTRLQMCEFLLEEGKSRQAVECICDVFAYDSNMLGFYDISDEYRLPDNSDFFKHIYSAEDTAPHVVAQLGAIQENLEVSSAEYRQLLLKGFSKACYPHMAFTDDESADLVIAMLSNDRTTIEQIYSQVNKRSK